MSYSIPPVSLPPVSICPQNRYEFARATLARLRTELPLPKVFDIGAGGAQLRAPLEQDGFLWRGFNHAAGVAGVEAWDLDEARPDLAGQTGAVLLLDVIEHCLNPSLALRHAAETIAPGGFLILTVPNPRWSGSRVHNLVYGYASGFTPHDLMENHHVFVPWPHFIARLIAGVGLTISSYTTLDGATTLWQMPGARRGLSRVALNAVQMAIEWRDRTAIGMSYALIARKPL